MIRTRFAGTRRPLAWIVAGTLCGALPQIAGAQAPSPARPQAVVSPEWGPALAREGDRVIFRRADGARVTVGYAALAEADRARIDGELAKIAGSGAAKIPPAADALVRLCHARPGGEIVTTNGIVFHAAGARAFIYVAGSLGGEPPFGELWAVVPGRDPEKRIPVQYHTAFGFGFGSSSTGVGILTGPRGELPEPVPSDPPYAAPTPGQAVTIVADVRPAVPGKASNFERMLLPTTIGQAMPDPRNPKRAPRNVIRRPAGPSVNDGLVLDEAGKLIGLYGWGSEQVNPSGEEAIAWTSTAFFAALRQGPVLGGAVAAIDGPDGKPQLKIDFALGSLAEPLGSIVIKAIALPKDQEDNDAIRAILAVLDATPPAMIDLGELKPATEAEMGKLRGRGRGHKPDNIQVEYRSLTVAAPQPFIDGQALLLLGYERDAAGAERRRFGLTTIAAPPGHDEAQRALQTARQQAVTAATAAEPPFSGNPRPAPTGTGAPRYDVNKPPKFLTPIPPAELK